MNNQPTSTPTAIKTLPDSVLSEGVYRFDNSAIEAICKCPRNAWYLQTYRRRRVRPDEAQSFGKAIHAGLELRYSTIGNQAPTPALQAQQDAQMAAIFAGVQLPEGEWRDLGRAKELLQRYNDEFRAEPWDVVATETPFEFELGTIPIMAIADNRGDAIQVPLLVKLLYQGRIDLTIRCDGKLYPVDFKTTSFWDPQREQDKFEVSGQMMGYCKSLEATHGELGGGAMVRWLVARKPTERASKIPRIEFSSRFFSYLPEQIEQWRQDTIRIAENWLNECVVAPPPHHRASCAWPKRCQFFEVCTCRNLEDELQWLSSSEYEHNDWDPMAARSVVANGD